jgi:hypothetical protein
MKKYSSRSSLLTSCLLLLVQYSLTLFGQEVQFTYDSCGNRTMQEIIQLREWDPGDNDVGVEEAMTEQELRIQLTPNPTRGTVELQLENHDKIIPWQLKIYSLTADLVYIDEQNVSMHRIDLTELQSGTYLVTVTINGIRKTWKLIKQ